MKHKLKLIFLLLAFFSLSLAVDAQNGKKNNGKDTVVFVVNMSCEKCEKRIKKNIAYEKGVSDLKVDLERGLVEIEYKKNKTDANKLLQAIQKLGYMAVDLEKNKLMELELELELKPEPDIR